MTLAFAHAQVNIERLIVQRYFAGRRHNVFFLAQNGELLADARAYEIRQLNEAIAENPAYLQLQAMEALKQISKDPSSKVYFINSDSPQPLPLMNIGDVLK